MRLAFECPTNLLKSVQPLADFDCILTHLVLTDKEYAEYYEKSTRFKILDNSVNEIGTPTSIKEIAEAASIVKPNLIVPPDYLNDHYSTIKDYFKCCSIFGKEKLLPVVQGSTPLYIDNCIDTYRREGSSYFAIPYTILTSGVSTEEMASTRGRAIKRLAISSSNDKFHLLGMTTLQELDYYRVNNYPIVSLDTGYPIANGLHGRKFGEDTLLSKDKPTLDHMKKPMSGEYPEIDYESVYYNIAYLRRLVNKE